MAALSRCAASTCLGRQLCSVPTLRRFASTSNRTLFPSLTDALLARKPSPSPTPSRAGNLAGRSYSTVASKATPPAGNRSRLAIAAGGLSLLALSSLYFLNPTEENLSPTRFIPLKVLAVEHMTKDTSLFKISLPKNLLPDPDQSISKPILSLYVMQPDLQIQRPYTVSPLPLSPLEHRSDSESRYWTPRRSMRTDRERSILSLRCTLMERYRGGCIDWDRGMRSRLEVRQSLGTTPRIPTMKSSLFVPLSLSYLP